MIWRLRLKVFAARDRGFAPLYMYWIRIWHHNVLVKARKAQLEAMRSSNQSAFESDCKWTTKVLSSTMKLARAAISSAKCLRSTPDRCFRAPSACRARPSNGVTWKVRISSAGAVFSSAVEYEEACSTSDFERYVASKHLRAVISTAQWLARTPEHVFTAEYANKQRWGGAFECC